jgi:hypothetical protein
MTDGSTGNSVDGLYARLPRLPKPSAPTDTKTLMPPMGPRGAFMAKAISEQFRLPEINASCRMLHADSSAWSLGGLIRAIALSDEVRSVKIMTYRISSDLAEMLNLLFASIPVTICVNPVQQLGTSRHKNIILAYADRNGWDVRFTRSHAKILIFDCAHHKYVIETSANTTSLRNHEFAVVSESAELHDFYDRELFGAVA